MKLYLLAFKNIFRNKRRTSLTAFLICISYVAMTVYLGYINNLNVSWKEILIHNDYGHLQITNAKYSAGDETSFETMISDSQFAIVNGFLEKDSSIEYFSPRLNLSGLIGDSKGSRIFLGSARNPNELDDLYYLNPVAHGKGSFLSDNNPNGIVVGEKLASKMNFKVGDHCVLMCNSAVNSIEAANLEIVGISKTGVDQLDAMSVMINYAKAQEIAYTSSCHVIVILLKNTDDMYRIQSKINTWLTSEHLGLRAKNFEENATFFPQIVQMYNNFFLLSIALLSLIICISIVNTIFMSISDRTREFSTMRTIGFSRFTIFKLIIYEGISISILSVIIGFIISYLVHIMINKLGLTLPPAPGSDQRIPFMVMFDFKKSIEVGGLNLIIAFIASTLPAISVIRKKIIQGLSNV